MRDLTVRELGAFDRSLQLIVWDWNAWARHMPRLRTPKDHGMSSLSKALALRDRAKQYEDDTVAGIDQTMAGYDALERDRDSAFEKHRRYQQKQRDNLAEAEHVIDVLSNVPLDDTSGASAGGQRPAPKADAQLQPTADGKAETDKQMQQTPEGLAANVGSNLAPDSDQKKT